MPRFFAREFSLFFRIDFVFGVRFSDVICRRRSVLVPSPSQLRKGSRRQLDRFGLNYSVASSVKWTVPKENHHEHAHGGGTGILDMFGSNPARPGWPRNGAKTETLGPRSFQQNALAHTGGQPAGGCLDSVRRGHALHFATQARPIDEAIVLAQDGCRRLARVFTKPLGKDGLFVEPGGFARQF